MNFAGGVVPPLTETDGTKTHDQVDNFNKLKSTPEPAETPHHINFSTGETHKTMTLKPVDTTPDGTFGDGFAVATGAGAATGYGPPNPHVGTGGTMVNAVPPSYAAVTIAPGLLMEGQPTCMVVTDGWLLLKIKYYVRDVDTQKFS